MIGNEFTPPTPHAWQDDAICATSDPELWFPDITGGSTIQPKQICATCDVATQCLEYALTHHFQYGIWGGTTARDRNQLIRNNGSAK